MNQPSLPSAGMTLLACTLVLSPSLRATDSAPASKIDFGDFSSATLTRNAWSAFEARDLPSVKAFTGQCQKLYAGKAIEMQKALKVPATGEATHSYWALNDVGTCCYILGKSLEEHGMKKEALEPYRFLVEELPFSQCYDLKGWFWKPAEAASVRLKALEFETL